ncbi:MAG: 3-hydroxyacyl-CoA dehydrogenase [Betaproteobacteria bacterium]|nr:3-hydroxyacyl-CoA dehydrogenase [Betaproteobacteria bacterium]
MIDVASSEFTLGVVGAGLMGGGIAQVAAQAGIRTLLFDAQIGAAARARQNIQATLGKLTAKGKISEPDMARALEHLRPADSLEAFRGCHVVIEAIVENLPVKQEVFRQLESVVTPACVLATNTSSLSVTAIASACKHPERVGGFHFFSPVPLMKIVEVINGVRTGPGVGELLTALAHRMGHAPVRAQDTPGFIVNHAGRGYGTEALRIVGEGVADFHVVDRVLRDGAGFRMGPFELMDLTGLDVSQPVMESIYHQYHEEPRFRPTPLLLQRKLAGLLGRKSGEGFYRYLDGVQQAVAPAQVPAARPASVWVSRRHAELRHVVAGLATALGANVETAERPTDNALCVVTPLGGDCTSAAVEEKLDPARTIAIDALFGLKTHRTLMANPLTAPDMREAALGLFQADGVAASIICDSAGLLAQRVIAHIVNIACDIAQQHIATPEDIDRAVTLGLGYRKGPLAMGDDIGAAQVLGTLESLHAFYRDPRYRPSPWLKRRALLGISLLSPDQI